MSKWLTLIKMLAPIIIATTVPHGEMLATLVAKGIEQAESFKGKTGKEKLVIAQSLVDTGIAGINAAKPGTIDPTAVHSTVAEGISMVVNTANLLHKKSLVIGQ